MYVDIANRSSSNLKGNQDGDNKSEGGRRWHRAVYLSDEFPFSHDRL
jgi:hypothetical protein